MLMKYCICWIIFQHTVHKFVLEVNISVAKNEFLLEIHRARSNAVEISPRYDCSDSIFALLLDINRIQPDVCCILQRVAQF